MRSALILAFYLGDQLISSQTPFSSGPFVIVLLLICIGRFNLGSRVLIEAVTAGTVGLGFGVLGAWLSGTTITVFFAFNIVALICMWTLGAGLYGRDSMLITARGAFVGVIVSSGFLLLAALGWDVMSLLLGASTNRPSGLYLEPSHFALFVMPLWLIAFQCIHYRPWLYLFLALFIGLCFSLTLVIFLTCAYGVKLYLYSNKDSLFIYGLGYRLTFSLGLAILAYEISDQIYIGNITIQEYIGSRLSGLLNPAETNNLSSLVVLQGLEMARISFVESFGLGVGLGNLGISPQIIDQSEYRRIINILISGEDLNLRDGGILINKLIGELGVFSLLVPIMLIQYLRKITTLHEDGMIKYHSAFASLLICTLFGRALSYFSAPLCLAILSVASILSINTKVPHRGVLIRGVAIE